MKQLLLICMIGFGGSLYAQDPHFSQYFSSPLTLNPANTGNIAGAQRLATNYRQQWMGIGNPYVTGTVSMDGKLLRNKLKEDDKLGVGVMALYDQTIGGALNSSYGAFSMAYHKGLDENGYQSLGIGFQSVLGSRKLDYSKISFANQFGSGGFNTALPSGEQFQTSSFIYFDFNIGAVFNYEDEEKSFYAGASYYHLPRPQQSFLGDTSYRLPARYQLQSGASMLVGDYGRVFVSATWMQQAGANEAALGASYAHSIPGSNDEQAIVAGLWCRPGDAVYPYLGVLTNGLLIGLSYDVTTSNLSLASTKNKSLEISCVYTFRDKMELKRLIPWY